MLALRDPARVDRLLANDGYVVLQRNRRGPEVAVAHLRVERFAAAAFGQTEMQLAFHAGAGADFDAAFLAHPLQDLLDDGPASASLSMS